MVADSPEGRRTFRIASRGSALARWQADHVAAALRALDAGFEVEVRIVRTTGDRITDVPLAQIGDRGLFTREVDDHVLRGDADAAVHSLKDLPTTLAAGLAIGAIMRREDPRDALVFGDPRIRRLEDLARGSTIGTSSLRRRAQLLAARPDLRILDVRGNVDTRLQSLDGGAFDAIVLAAAGLHRLGLRHRIGAYLEPPDWLPAVGQGALAVTCAAGGPAEAVLRPLAHAATASAVLAERAFLRALEGGCQVPIGALAEVHGGDLRLAGMVAALDGARVVRGDVAGAADEAERLGGALARRLSEQGAASLLAEARAAAAAPAD